MIKLISFITTDIWKRTEKIEIAHSNQHKSKRIKTNQIESKRNKANQPNQTTQNKPTRISIYQTNQNKSKQIKNSKQANTNQAKTS